MSKKTTFPALSLLLLLGFFSSSAFISLQQVISKPDNLQSDETLTLLLNGIPFQFENHVIQNGDITWLPGNELFRLMDLYDISFSDGSLHATYFDQNHQHVECRFSAGDNTYSVDTLNNLTHSIPVRSFKLNDVLYIPEQMLEGIFGDFITIDADNNIVSINLSQKHILTNQSDNENPLTQMKLKDASLLRDSRINTLVSGMMQNPVEDWIGWSQSQLKNDGFSEARATYNFSDGPAVDFTYADAEKEIPMEFINFYAQLRNRGISTRFSLTFWDMQYRLEGGTLSYDRLSTEEERERYLDYVRMVVTSLKGLVDSYELWNEPDANRDFYQRITPQDYVEIARLAIPLIREIDPDAKIVLVSTSSYVGKETQEYSQHILESDVVQLADAISLHTVNNDASPVFLSEYYYGYDAMWDAIKVTAETNGFTGEYYADELNYRSDYSLGTLQPEPGDYHPYQPEVATKYLGRMIAINRGMDISVGTSGTNSFERFYEGIMIRNLAYLLDGLDAAKFPVVVNSNSTLVRYYTFMDQAGKHYLAIWNDDAAAVDYDGAACNLTLPDLSASAVTIYDPFNSLQQELNFSTNDDGLVLEGLTLSDYPKIIMIE
ncbi:MAG TPA: hypothetical protein DCK95_02770 [Anaerolineaceae bacterium]|uniref:YVTN beta-propeller repeat-containing protein n=1 Tax=Anaerolinea thermophila TaxID=167964 RepID=A0A124FN26_9CHLR|nr:MAG: YVTN beta-propeller repeat-containing protein [Anaerolinea thermophila]HAF61231.1 hypothetical protein [Anaerolineaceae bacterium]